MHRLFGLVFAALAVSAPLAPARAAQAPLVAEVLSYGEYEPVAVESVEEAPDTTSGELQIVEVPRLWRATSSVSASPGVLFGIVVEASNLGEGETREVTVTVNYPEVEGPDGQRVSRDVFSAELGRRPEFFGFCFGEDWALNPGTWSITVAEGERLVVHQVFDVTLGPPLTGRPDCDPAQAVS